MWLLWLWVCRRLLLLAVCRRLHGWLLHVGLLWPWLLLSLPSGWKLLLCHPWLHLLGPLSLLAHSTLPVGPHDRPCTRSSSETSCTNTPSCSTCTTTSCGSASYCMTSTPSGTTSGTCSCCSSTGGWLGPGRSTCLSKDVPGPHIPRPALRDLVPARHSTLTSRL